MRVNDEIDALTVYKAHNLPNHYENLCIISIVESKLMDSGRDVNFSDVERKMEPEEFQFLNNAKVCKGKTKKLCEKNIVHHEFKPGQFILLLKLRLKLFPGKLKPRWSSP